MADGLSLSVLAFAEDLVAFADTHTEAQKILNSIAASLSLKGMEMNIGKCAAMSVKYVHGSPAILSNFIVLSRWPSHPPGVGFQYVSVPVA